MTSSDTPRAISRSSFRFFSGTLLSRISGMLRDMSMAFCFGTSPTIAAFLLAYRFVYLLRRLFGEGISHGLIPHYESEKTKGKGSVFFRDLFTSYALILAGVFLLIEVVVIWTLQTDVLTEGGREITRFAAYLIPGIYLISLFGLTNGLLHAERKFFLPAVAPVLSNLIWIGGVFSVVSLPMPKALFVLAGVITFGCLVQWGITWPITLRLIGGWKNLKPRPFHKDTFVVARPIALGLIGVAATQIGSAVDGLFARFASLEGPAYLWYAIRIAQLPLALFGLALSSALFPSMTRAVEKGDQRVFQDLFSFGMKRSFTLIFPCMIGIFVLGAASVNLLFGRGDFSSMATEQTTLCLWCYGVGLLPAVFTQILAASFYARKQFALPAIATAVSVGCNIGLNALLVFGLEMGAPSVALATSIASWGLCLYLWIRIPSSTARSIIEVSGTMKKIALLTGFSGGIALVFGLWIGDATTLLWQGKDPQFVRTATLQLVQFFSQTGLYFLVFFGVGWCLKIPEIIDLLKSYSFSKYDQRKSTS